MGIKYYFFNTLLFAALAVSPCRTYAADTLAPFNFKGIYECSFAGIRFGMMGFEIEQTPQHYAMTADIASSGIVNMFAKHTSHTIAEADGHDFTYSNVEYESHYQTKKKPKYAKLVYKNGLVSKEQVIPPDNRETRPAVSAQMKKNSSDPLSLILNVRQSLYEARKNHKKNFTVNVYDGRRLTEGDFTIGGTKTLLYNNTPTPVITVSARRKLLAGFTESELASHDPNEMALYIYFTDDARLIPIRLETTFLFSTITAVLAKECRTGESCLLGIKG